MKTNYLAAVAVALAGTAGSALAQTAYNNQGSDNGGYLINGATEQNGVDVTNTDFQLFTLSVPAGTNYINNVSEDFYNGNSSAVNADVLFGFWTDNGSGAPGQEFLQFGAALSLNQGTNGNNFEYDGIHTIDGIDAAVPTDGKVWMSITFFDNGDPSLISAAQLNNLSPATSSGLPSVGNTDGQDWYAPSGNDQGGNGFNGSPNPSVINWGSGENFGARIDTAPGATPEPVTMGLGIAGIGLAIRRRLKAK